MYGGFSVHRVSAGTPRCSNSNSEMTNDMQSEPPRGQIDSNSQLDDGTYEYAFGEIRSTVAAIKEQLGSVTDEMRGQFESLGNRIGTLRTQLFAASGFGLAALFAVYTLLNSELDTKFTTLNTTLDTKFTTVDSEVKALRESMIEFRASTDAQLDRLQNGIDVNDANIRDALDRIDQKLGQSDVSEKSTFMAEFETITLEKNLVALGIVGEAELTYVSDLPLEERQQRLLKVYADSSKSVGWEMLGSVFNSMSMTEPNEERKKAVKQYNNISPKLPTKTFNNWSPQIKKPSGTPPRVSPKAHAPD